MIPSISSEPQLTLTASSDLNDSWANEELTESAAALVGAALMGIVLVVVDSI